MTVGFSPGRLASRLVGRRPANVVLDGPAWNPGRLTTIRQRFLDELRTYQSSLIGGYPALTSEESGTVAVPRGGRCFLFDGSDDYATLGARLTSGTVTALTVSCWLKASSNDTTQFIASERDSGNYWELLIRTDGKIHFETQVGATIADANTSISENQWYHIAGILRSTGELELYLNGAIASSTTSGAITGLTTETFHIGGLGAAFNLSGSLRDVRIYSVAKSAAEVLAIANQEEHPDTIDRTGLLAGWWCEEESGTTARDWSGNGHHLTLMNTSGGTFHATDSGVTYSAANSLGHTLSGSVVVPRDESDPTKDASGGSLQYAGPLKLPATTEVPCLTLNGTSSYATLGARLTSGTLTTLSASCWIKFSSEAGNDIGLVGEYTGSGNYSWLFWFYEGKLYFTASANGTTTVDYYVNQVINDGAWYHVAFSYNAGSLSMFIDGVQKTTVGTGLPATLYNSAATFRAGIYGGGNGYFPGSISDLRVSTDTKTEAEILAIKNGATDETGLLAQWPMQEGPGDDNTNRTMYDVSGNGNDLTIVNGTVANIWANVCPNVRDHQLQCGGRLNANNVCIPALLDGSEAADGNALNLTAGKRGNRGTLIAPNIFGAPSLVRLGLTTETRYAFGEDVQAIDPDNTKFRRTAASGDDRYFVSDTALVGVNLTNAEAYTA